jgi:hypothetical protein
LQITTTSLPNGANGVFYSQQLQATGGQPPYNWSLAPASASLPPGLALATDGVISGTPTNNGFFPFTVRVTDALATNVDQALSITVTPPPGPPTVIEDPQFLPTGEFQFSFNTLAGTNYTLLYSTTLTSWFPIVTFRSPGGMMTIIDPNTADPMRFYRVRTGP